MAISLATVDDLVERHPRLIVRVASGDPDPVEPAAVSPVRNAVAPVQAKGG